jgi:hypothetical protein
VEGEQGKPNVEFTQDGVLKAAELKIMNLRPGVSKQLIWEEVSTKVCCTVQRNEHMYRYIVWCCVRKRNFA